MYLQQLLRAVGVLLVGLLFRFAFALYEHRRRLNGLPKPPYHWLLGHLPTMARLSMSLPSKIHPHTLVHYLKRTYDLPDIFYLDTWPIGDQICAIVDPEVAHHVTIQHSLPKHDALERAITPITGPKSLVALEGKEHKKWRSVFNPGFSSSHLMTLVPGIVDDCVTFVSVLQKHVEEQDTFSLEEAATGVTVDVIGRVVLDAQMHAQTSANEFVSAFRNLLTWLPKSGEINPFKIFNPIRPLVLRYDAYKMDRYLLAVIKARLQSRNEDGPQERKKRAKPIIDLALDVYLEEEGKGASKRTEAVFSQAALTHIKVFMFAGHDTTSSTLCYTAYALSKHPEILQKFRAECDEVFGPDPKETAQKIKDDPRIINRLSYTVAIIKETLRLWPPASSVRAGEPGFIIHHDGQQYPTDGFMTWPVAHAIHHSPKFWPEAETFIPERFLAKEGDPLFPVRGAWRAFEYGPRNCIGQELAMIEARIVMVLMLREYTIELAYDETPHEGQKGGVKPTNTPEGEGAYQVRLSTAEPAEGMPSRVKRNERSSAEEKRSGQPKVTPEGERAYQVLIATAKPVDGMPARIERK